MPICPRACGPALSTAPTACGCTRWRLGSRPFIAGASDWGVYQAPGAFEALGTRACSRFEGSRLIPAAGHWVHQEQPQAVVDLLLEFLRRR
jgi:pimeloyl-ACP methyl ester carboxylesterase